MVTVEEVLSFENSIRGLAPSIHYEYHGGLRIASWENPDRFEQYRSSYPPSLPEAGQKMDADKPLRWVIVSDSENMRRKAALFLAMKRFRKLCEGRKPDEQDAKAILHGDGKIAVLELDLASEGKKDGNKEENWQKWDSAIQNLGAFNTLFVTGFQSGEMREEYFRSLLQDPGCGIVAGVSEALFKDPQIQRLIYEGGFEPLFLPEEKDDYYVELILKTAVNSARMNYILTHPDENVDVDRLFEENPFLGMVGLEDRTMLAAVRKLRKRRGKGFQETDIPRLLEMARESESSVLEVLNEKHGRTPNDLDNMVGLDGIKNLAKRWIARRNAGKRNPMLKENGMNSLLSGGPGSGKTISATLLHEVLTTAGCITGDLVIATRTDIIGRYVGQTAPKVEQLFDKAKGGILFVDEAGFFLQQNTGGFVQEALKEFVRLMETDRDVSVIFAVYPGEKEDFLKLDAGLSSRISQVVEFPDYSDEELSAIGKEMWREQGYSVEPDVESTVVDFIGRRRNEKGEMFGNAREVRRLVELSIQEAELRHLENFEDGVSGMANSDEEVRICKKDVELAADLVEKDISPKNRLGFFADHIETEAPKMQFEDK